MDSLKLVAFDLDGVLIHAPGSWMEVHKGLGTQEKAIENATSFFSGKISFEDWVKLDVSLWVGEPIKKIEEILDAIPLRDGVEDTFQELKDMGVKIAIISGGLKLLADKIRRQYNLDYCVGNEFTVEEGLVTGTKGDVDFYGKGNILRDISEKEGIKPSNCACIGDHINDIPMFEIAGYSIAFNPQDEKLIEKADKIIEGENLTEILPILKKLKCTPPQQT